MFGNSGNSESGHKNEENPCTEVTKAAKNLTMFTVGLALREAIKAQ